MADRPDPTALHAECRALQHGILRLAAQAEALASLLPADDSIRGALEVVALDLLPAAAAGLADV